MDYMNANRIVMTLITVTIALQLAILYRQSGFGSGPTSAVRNAPDSAVLNIHGAPVIGSDDAKVVLVEFSDYDCPFCALHSTNVAPQLTKEYVRTGKIRHAFLNNPLPIHPNSPFLATAAICAGEQGKFWGMHDRLFSSRLKDKQEIIAIARDQDLNMDAFIQCLDRGDAATRIRQDAEQARDLGVRGAPAFASVF
jgi:protein-disulfide isomerase